MDLLMANLAWTGTSNCGGVVLHCVRTGLSGQVSIRGEQVEGQLLMLTNAYAQIADDYRRRLRR